MIQINLANGSKVSINPAFIVSAEFECSKLKRFEQDGLFDYKMITVVTTTNKAYRFTTDTDQSGNDATNTERDSSVSNQEFDKLFARLIDI